MAIVDEKDIDTSCYFETYRHLDPTRKQLKENEGLAGSTRKA